MTCRIVSAQQGAVRQWTRRLKLSVIQRAKPVESPRQGQSSTLSFPRRNQPGGFFGRLRLPLNDSKVLEYVVVIMVEPFGGFFGRLRSL